MRLNFRNANNESHWPRKQRNPIHVRCNWTIFSQIEHHVCHAIHTVDAIELSSEAIEYNFFWLTFLFVLTDRVRDHHRNVIEILKAFYHVVRQENS